MILYDKILQRKRDVMEDTIVAISTTMGVGAISIIRLSGEDAINIVNKIFTKDLSKVLSHTIHYGYIKYEGKMIDEVLISVMLAPKTFTREDVVEINCHGGVAVTNKILEILLENGARLAQPGEFTKRAFLNGRIDLLEAEATMDLISSKTEKARALSINTLTGDTSNMIRNLRSDLVSIISNIEVNIDYPEYEDIEILTNEKILPSIEKFKDKLQEIIKKSNDSKIIKEGINVGIIGKPNVGKSSLLNLLIEEDKAIVTNIPGTTRDIVEGSIILNGVIFNIIDTAGIRSSLDVVEKIGIEKSLKIIDSSDLIIFILNNNDYLSKEEENILKKIKNKKKIIVINKIDLESKLDKNLLDDYIEISAKDNIGIDKLKEEMKRLFRLGEITSDNMTYLSNARSISLLNKAVLSIDDSIKEINSNSPIDIVEMDLKDAWNYLGEIIGEVYTDELLDELFKRFCLGK